MLRRLSVALALSTLFAGPAFAQADFGLLGVDNGVIAAASYTGLGDIVSGAKAYYGLRGYSAAIAALGNVKAINITRASDSMSCDVVIATSGDLGNVVTTGGCTASGTAASFCSATTCSLNKWYDQAGGAAGDASVVGTHPTLSFSCVSSKACIVFGGAGGFEALSAGSTAQALSVSALVIRTGGTGQSDILSEANGVFITGAFASGTVSGFFGGAPAGPSEADNSWHALQWVVNGSSSEVNVDGVRTTGLALGANALDAGYFIGQQSSGSYLTGDMFEIALYGPTVSFTSTQQTNLCHNQSVYLSLGLSC